MHLVERSVVILLAFSNSVPLIRNLYHSVAHSLIMVQFFFIVDGHIFLAIYRIVGFFWVICSERRGMEPSISGICLLNDGRSPATEATLHIANSCRAKVLVELMRMIDSFMRGMFYGKPFHSSVPGIEVEFGS